MKLKDIIKTILFILVFVIIWNYVFSVVWTTKNSIGTFYDEPKNSLDVIYVGSSNAYAHFNTVLAYNNYGFTTGMLSSDGQPFNGIKYLLEEGKKYQDAKVYVVDITCIHVDLSFYNDGDMRKVFDNMKFSQNRIDAIDEMTGSIGIEKSQRIPYYFSFLAYHNSWKYIGDYSFNTDSLFKGHILAKTTTEIAPQETYVWKNKVTALPEANQKMLQNLIDYTKENDMEVIFVVPIRTYAEENNERLNDAIRILKENDMQVINFNALKDFTIDFSKDLYNSGHINVFGSTKYTNYFAKYLDEKYNLPDHRNDEKYSSWAKEYDRYVMNYELLTESGYDNTLGAK